MCFSFEVSLATGIFSWGAGFYLLNNRNLSISQKHDVIFLLLFSSMQFIDAILWYIKMEKNWVNFILTSFFIPLILIAQAVYNIYYRNNISHPLIDIVFIAGIIYLFRKFHGYSSSMECNRLSSPVWGSNELSIWEIMLYATFIFYLNDNFTGGETDFPKRNISTKPKRGKGVLFFNLNDDNTDRRDKSFHAGLPPNTGEKWMCNKWIRMNPHT